MRGWKEKRERWGKESRVDRTKKEIRAEAEKEKREKRWRER